MYIMMVVAILFNIGLFYYKKIKSKRTHGSASWLTKKELNKLINEENNGLVIDGINRLSRSDSKENLIIVAPTGQGKSTGFVIPNIILAQNYSTVVVDPSGEIYDATASSMQRMGYNVKLWSPERKESHSFNILNNIKSIKDAGMVGDSLMSRLASQSSPIWHKAGGTLLQSIFYYLYLKSELNNQNYMNMTNVIRFLTKTYEEQELLMDSVADSNLDFLYSGFRDANKEAKGGIQLMAKEGVELFLEDKVKRITDRHNMDFKELREKKTIFYLMFPELEIEYYSPLLQVFFGQLFHFANKNREGYEIFTIIEEAGNMGKIPNLPKATTTLRKFGVSISLVLQELSQLDVIYGKENAEVIKSGGCVTKLFLPGLGRKACHEISEVLGTETIKSESKNKSENSKASSSSGKTKSNIGRPLMKPDEIRKMKTWTTLMIRKNEKPVTFKVTPAFNQKRFKHVLDYSKANDAVLDINSGDPSIKFEIDEEIKSLKLEKEKEMDLKKELKNSEESSYSPDGSSKRKVRRSVDLVTPDFEF